MNEHHDDTTPVENLPPLLQMVVANLDKFHVFLSAGNANNNNSENKNDAKRILDASKENETECAKPKGVRRGYMGHITTISAGLVQTASADPVIDKLLSEIPEWGEYVKGPLAQTREREMRRLANYETPGID